MPRPTLQSPHARSPRSNLASSSYDTRNLPNPFQDTSSTPVVSKNTFLATTVAPVASDTVPSSISTTNLSDRSRAPIQRRENSNSSLNDQSRSNSSTTQSHRENSRLNSSQHQKDTLSRQQQDPSFVRQDETAHDQGQEQEHEQENPLIYLTASQREAAVENLEIESMPCEDSPLLHMTQKLRASIGVLTNSLRFRSEAEFNRLPAAIRTMTVEEFWFTYNGSAKEYLEQQNAKKSIANTSFLHALGITDHKKTRETMGQSDELWRSKQKSEDGIERTSQNAARYRPYPEQSQPHRTSRPFVDSRLGFK